MANRLQASMLPIGTKFITKYIGIPYEVVYHTPSGTFVKDARRTTVTIGEVQFEGGARSYIISGGTEVDRIVR